MERNPSSSKVDRKTIEKNRRNYMKSLVMNLTSLMPPHSGEVLTLPDQLQEATNYIKKLQANMEKMRERRDSLSGGSGSGSGSGGGSGSGSGRSTSSEDTTGSFKLLPQIEIHEKDSVLEVILMTGMDSKIMFKEIIKVLHEEGAEVVNASFSLVDNEIVHQTIHSKIGDCEPHYGAARISERVKKLVYG